MVWCQVWSIHLLFQELLDLLLHGGVMLLHAELGQEQVAGDINGATTSIILR